MNRIASLIFALAAFGTASQSLQAALATPAGIFTRSITAGKTQYLGTPFVRPEVSIGEIVSVSGNVITVRPEAGDLTYTSNEYAGYTGATTGNEPYILEVLDGDQIGYIGFIQASTVTSSGTAQITVDVAPGTVPVGSRYAIRPDWTVETLFGSAETSPLKATIRKTQSSSAADQIQLIGSNGRVATTVFRKWNLSGDATSQTGVGFIWSSTGVTGDARKVRLPYSAGIILKALAGSNYDLTLAGDLRQSRLRKDILGYPRYNFVANTAAKDLPLSETGIAITPGADVFSADTLGILNVATGQLAQYYLDSAGDWRDADDNLANAVTIPKGTAVVIRRNVSRTGNLSGNSAVKISPVLKY